MSILASTKIRNWGILPHGVDDPSIIIKSDLTSQASITGVSGGSVSGTPPTFDSVKGLTTTTGTVYAFFNSPTGYSDLDAAGQISFEMESSFLADNDLGGGNATSNLFAMTCASTSGTGGSLRARFWKGLSTDKINFFDTVNQTNTDIQKWANPDFVRVTISWKGSTYDTFLDGRHIGKNLTWTNTGTTDFMRYLYIGSDRGNAGAGIQGYYIRNLQVSSRPVMFAVHPTLANLCIVGHSFVNAAKEVNPPAAQQWDMAMGAALKAKLSESGLFSTVSYYGESGGAIDTTLTAAIYLTTVIANSVASRPTVVVMIAGTNDVHHAQWNKTDFQTAYESAVDDFVATAEIVVVCTVTTQKSDSTFDNDTVVANVAEANEVINALPAYNSKVIVCDDFTNFGGETLGSGNLEGDRTGALNDLHPSAIGAKIEADGIAKALIQGILR